MDLMNYCELLQAIYDETAQFQIIQLSTVTRTGRMHFNACDSVSCLRRDYPVYSAGKFKSHKRIGFQDRASKFFRNVGICDEVHEANIDLPSFFKLAVVCAEL
jgi:hypothetical protein